MIFDEIKKSEKTVMNLNWNNWTVLSKFLACGTVSLGLRSQASLPAIQCDSLGKIWVINGQIKKMLFLYRASKNWRKSLSYEAEIKKYFLHYEFHWNKINKKKTTITACAQMKYQIEFKNLEIFRSQKINNHKTSQSIIILFD